MSKEDWWLSFAAGIAANVTTTLTLLILGFSVFFLRVTRQRKKLLKFFGISRELPQHTVYISRMIIKAKGSEGAEAIFNGYEGPATSKIEYDAAVLLQRLLEWRSAQLLPKSLHESLGRLSIALAGLEPRITFSPRVYNGTARESAVSIGGAVYNGITKYYFDSHRCKVYFEKQLDGHRAVVELQDSEKRTYFGRSEKRELGIVQCIRSEQSTQAVFICAGSGSSATFGSVRYLVKNWRRLDRKYTGGFAVCLSFPNQPPDAEEGETVTTPTILFDKPC